MAFVSRRPKEKWTSKPCHGCKEPGRRPADGLCHTCRQLLADAKAARDALIAAEDVKFYGLAFAAHGLPRIREDREVQKAFFALVPLLGKAHLRRTLDDVQCESLIEHQEETQYSDQAKVVALQPRVVKRLQQLYAAMQATAEEAYRKGRERGESLIESLADGSLSLKDLNERTIGRTRT